MVVYSAESGDQYPLVLPPDTGYTYTIASNGAGGIAGPGTTTSADKVIDTYYNTSTKYQNGNPLANLWILVLRNATSPKQFICKSDPVPTNTANLQTAANYYINFNGGTSGTSTADYAYSYSVAYPWTGTGTSLTGAPYWKNTTDSSLPIMSDVAPLSGTGSNPQAQTPGNGSGPPTNGAKAWNSSNHQRDGQNVGFADAHTEFVRRADVGQSNDNIFTSWNSTTAYNVGAAQTSAGTVTGLGTNQSPPFDIVMVPIANVATGARQ
jgi:hypothetical protein